VDDLKVSDFAVGDDFSVEAGGSQFTLRVVKVEPLPPAAREAGAFRLEFEGPAETVVPQGTYAFRGSRRSDDIFIVPIAKDQANVRYEAIFI
jgi:hypothetical protein